MEADIKKMLDGAEEKMKKAVAHLDAELLKLRAGKATPNILDGITVDYYGAKTPLNQVASINTPDAKTINIQPWEKKIIDAIEKAILASNIGLTPVNNGEVIRLSVPPLTEERRKDLVKQVKGFGEQAKVAIRNTRKEMNEELKRLQKKGLAEDMEKDAEDKVQKITDRYVQKVDELMGLKEKEIMTV